MKGMTILISLIVLLAIGTASARTWYVTPEGTGDAPTIQAGIDSAAVGDTVLVAAGAYTEACQDTPDGPSMLVVDTGLHLISEDGRDVTVLDAQGACRVIYMNSVSDSILIEGFTITGGYAGDCIDADEYDVGGGLYSELCQLVIRDCVISENVAVYGGGLYMAGIEVTVAHCEICDNTAEGVSYGIETGVGAGAYGIYATFVDCYVHDNYARAQGGGIYCMGGAIECVFSGNRAFYEGAALYCGNTSGCLFVSNTVLVYGACVYATGAVENCTFRQNTGGCIIANELHTGPSVESCTFYRNSGHAIRVDFASTARVTNCTVYGNIGDAIVVEPGWSHGGPTQLSLANTIVAYTTDGGAVRSCGTFECDAIIECCCLWNNEDGDYVGGIADQEGVNGNFSACPSFCYADNGDFHLCDESPCLPGNHPDGYDCGLIGAWGEGCSCGPTQVDPTTWGAIKSMYR